MTKTFSKNFPHFQSSKKKYKGIVDHRFDARG